MTVYSNDAIRQLIETYLFYYNGDCITIEEGVLAMGHLLLIAKNKKAIIIKEVYLNDWNSGNSVRMYNTLPKKYEKYLN